MFPFCKIFVVWYVLCLIWFALDMFCCSCCKILSVVWYVLSIVTICFVGIMFYWYMFCTRYVSLRSTRYVLNEIYSVWDMFRWDMCCTRYASFGYGLYGICFVWDMFRLGYVLCEICFVGICFVCVPLFQYNYK